MQLDDDCIGLYRIYRPQGSWKKSVVGPERTYELLQATADRARSLGAYLFGWGSHAKPLTYNGLKPFRFGGYSPGGAIGLLEGAKVWWPTDTTLGDGDDYWVCLLNAHVHRYAFYDRRFSFAFRNTYTGAGGLSEFRVGDSGRDDLEHKLLAYLQRAFGKDVIVRNYQGPSYVTKKALNPGKRRS